MDQWFKMNVQFSTEDKKRYAKFLGLGLIILLVITAILLIVRINIPTVDEEGKPNVDATINLILMIAFFIEIIAFLISAIVFYGDGSFFSSSIVQTLITGVLLVLIIILWQFELLKPLDSLILTTIAVGLRMFWYLYEKWREIGTNQKLGIVTALFILGLNAFFQLMNIVFGAEVYRGSLATGFAEEMYWSIRFAIAPLCIYPILFYFDHKADIQDDISALNQRSKWEIFNFMATFSFVLVYILMEVWIFPYILQYDQELLGGAIAGMIYEGQQTTNYFSYVFFILLQSPAPALMIGFMVFGAVTVMISQNISGVGKVISGFATGVVVIIPMLFIFSIFSGGIRAPDLLITILGSGVAQFVFGLAETSAFILMLSIIAVFISAGRLLGNIT